MYISRIEINQYRHDTMRALASPQIMHAALAASFPAREGGRLLWRLDKLGDHLYIILVSQQKPDFTHMVEQFGWPAAEQKWETKEYEPFLENLKEGQLWRFRLRANPVHSVKKNADSARGQVVHHITVEHQKKWLTDRSLKNGFIISDNQALGNNQVGFDLIQSELKKFKRGDKRVTVSAVTFEGILKIQDVQLFTGILKNGIGRAKAYGCGLLTLAKL